jgi:hypothetical protein
MPATIGLYHPYIHFRDDAWLKRSALYWDRMARIVPPSYQRDPTTAALERDSAVTRQLIDDLDYVVNLPPSEVTYPLSSVFTQVLVRHADALRERYAVSRSGEWPADPHTSRYAQLRNPALAYVHSSKLDPYLIGQLQGTDLAVEHNENGHFWVGMHPRLAHVYMAALAEELATYNRFNPTTPEPVDHVAALGWGLDRLTAALLDEHRILDAGRPAADAASESTVDPEGPAMLAMIAVSVPVPADAAALPVSKLAEIRRDYRPELSRFQAFARAFAEEQLRDLDLARADPVAVRAHMKAGYEARILPMVDELRRALRGRGLDTVEAAMATSIVEPPALQSLGTPEPIALGAAAVFSLLPVLRAKRRAAQDAYRESPVSYLLRLEEKLTPQSTPARVRRWVRRFLTGV